MASPTSRTAPLDPQRESGIRLWVGAALHGDRDAEAQMMADLLDEIVRLRSVEQGLRTELSVHERRVRVSSLSMFTEAEEGMLKFCIDSGYQVYLSNDGFTEADGKAMDYLREMVGL